MKKTGAKRKLGTRLELQLMIAKATDLYVAGCPPRRIATQVDRTAQTVERWMKARKIQPPSVRDQELWEANLIKAEALALHEKAPDIEEVARRLQTPAHIVRAAIYLARQEQERTDAVQG